MMLCTRPECQTTAGCICNRRSWWLIGGPDTPLVVSAGGIPYNKAHIDYWRERALKAEADEGTRAVPTCVCCGKPAVHKCEAQS